MKLFLFLGLILLSRVLYATSTDTIIEGDTLEKIAMRNLSSVAMKYGEDFKNYAKDIKKWNPKIRDWNHPPKNQKIYVDYPYDVYVLGSTWSPDLGVALDNDEFNQKFSMNAFYATSFGSYSELASEQTVKSGQNFPVTFGLGFSATSEEKIHFIQSSLYWAQASKGNVSGNSASSTTSFSIPGEVGANLYYQYYLSQYSLAFYSGYDYEKLNTFNTDQIISGTPINNIESQLHYATVGAFKGFSLLDLKMNFKASVSKIISSSTNGTKALTGTKYILFYTYKPQGRLSFNVFYKHHNLQGPTQLSIDRIGFSVGIILF